MNKDIVENKGSLNSWKDVRGLCHVDKNLAIETIKASRKEKLQPTAKNYTVFLKDMA